MMVRPLLLQRALAIVAGLFGIVTLVSGGRVLLGADPGYVVYRPLLLFNTAMGAVYLATGALAWFDVRRGSRGAWLIVVLNASMLAFIAWLFLGGSGAVARQSVAAMSLRTGVWLLLAGGFSWAGRRIPVPASS